MTDLRGIWGNLTLSTRFASIFQRHSGVQELSRSPVTGTTQRPFEYSSAITDIGGSTPFPPKNSSETKSWRVYQNPALVSTQPPHSQSFRPSDPDVYTVALTQASRSGTNPVGTLNGSLSVFTGPLIAPQGTSEVTRSGSVSGGSATNTFTLNVSLPG